MSNGLLVDKMEGLGNTQALVKEDPWLEEIGYDKVARAVCNPVYGVAADQMILWTRLPWKGEDVGMSIYNGPDGEEVEMCGNGARCLAQLAKDKLIDPRRKTLRINTSKAGLKTARYEDGGAIALNMGAGVYEGEREVDLVHRVVRGHVVNVGNPHFVVFDEDPHMPRHGIRSLTKQLGPDIETHPDFPNRTNVEFVARRERRGAVDVEVWERGAGYTLACGTGACAVAFAGYKAGLLDQDVNVRFPLGALQIHIGSRDQITMTGPVGYCGQVIIPDLASAIVRTEALREALE